ncbi:PAS domain S-box-containing protein [Mucilaginibacter pineti]|uniref:histidine kinase n=1 Tax=Mucilaginibacter pineti TaxID=1391627 RepID=A0A1G7H7D3_9SPHI|nr:ATP-binding protein [Mucilaginibacter pineti]SDE96184.1 PAS domain S-box-containing protein [Mucilaginibacter pineti]
MVKTKGHNAGEDSHYHQLILNSIDDYAIFTTDKHGFVSSWNTGAGQVLGYQADEIIGKDSAIFFTTGDLKKSANKKELKNAKRFGSAVDERYHVRKDGSVFWASGKMFPLLDTDGKHLGFTKVMRNLDERKMAEDQLNQLKNYAEAIVSNSRQPILVLTGDLIIYAANDAFYNLFGLHQKAAENSTIAMLGNRMFHIPELANLLEQVRKSGNAVENFELEHDWPSLGKKYFLINASKLKHPVNTSNLILFSVEDVTERKSFEQQKDDFISIASHEIKTPVTVIKSYAQILRKRAMDSGDQFLANTAEKVNEKTDKLMSLVGYLLDTSQLELGELIIKKTIFDLAGLITECVIELKLIDKHTFFVRGKKSVSVFADRVRISQVINNLLNNACKYSPPDKPVTVNIKMNKKLDMVTVSVTDEGIGIPKSEQLNLFKRFWRASSATSRKISGIGLGLHISKAIIGQHGGKIWLKSEKDKGSVFSFSLPTSKS